MLFLICQRCAVQITLVACSRIICPAHCKGPFQTLLRPIPVRLLALLWSIFQRSKGGCCTDLCLLYVRMPRNQSLVEPVTSIMQTVFWDIFQLDYCLRLFLSIKLFVSLGIFFSLKFVPINISGDILGDLHSKD